jgi:hypothetical protein
VTTVVPTVAVTAALVPAAVESTRISVPYRSRLHHQVEPSIRLSSLHFAISFVCNEFCFELLAFVSFGLRHLSVRNKGLRDCKRCWS